MAVLQYGATVNAKRNVTVTASTDDALGAYTAAILIDNTANFFTVVQALAGALRRFHRDKSKNSKVSTIATSGATTE